MTEQKKCKHEWKQNLEKFGNLVEPCGYYCIHCLQLVRDRDGLIRLNKFEEDND